MKECKFCKGTYEEIHEFCPLCGYDPKIDTINPSYRKDLGATAAAAGKIRSGKGPLSGLGPGVKKFAFAGLAIVIFSLLYTYGFSLINGLLQATRPKPKAHVGIEPGELIPIKVEFKKKPAGAEEEYVIFDPPNPLKLEGVTWGKGAVPQAVINSMVYHLGDTIQGAKIIKIGKSGVVVLYEGRSYLIPSFVSQYKKETPSNK